MRRRSSARVPPAASRVAPLSIEIDTIDEIPTGFRLHFHGIPPSSLRSGNGSVRGQSLYLAASAKRGFSCRTGVGVYDSVYQVFGWPCTMALVAERAGGGHTA